MTDQDKSKIHEEELEFSQLSEEVKDSAFDKLISEYINRLDVLQRENEILREQREFAVTISHELRTPISVISGNLELMREGRIDKELVNTSYREVLEMGYIVRNWIIYSEIGEHYIVSTSSTVLLSDFINNAVEAVERKRAYKNIRLNLVSSNDTGTLNGDINSLSKIFEMILGNAYVYNKEGGNVELAVLDEGSTWRFSISDSGIGIPMSEQFKVFSKFFRATNASLGKNLGGGISLYLAKEVIEAHGGTIGFKSEEGMGSTFWFTLPKVTKVK